MLVVCVKMLLQFKTVFSFEILFLYLQKNYMYSCIYIWWIYVDVFLGIYVYGVLSGSGFDF